MSPPFAGGAPMMVETVVEWGRCCGHGGRVRLGARSPQMSLTGDPTSTLNCRHGQGQSHAREHAW